MKKFLILIVICFSFVLSGCSNSSFYYTRELDVLNVYTIVRGNNTYYHVQAVDDNSSLYDIEFLSIGYSVSVSVGDSDRISITYFKACDSDFCNADARSINLILTEETIKSINNKE